MASTLSIAEHRMLRAQWLRSGRCLRCFHTTRYALAAEAQETKVSPRRQRAAAVASEISALAADDTPSSHQSASQPSAQKASSQATSRPEQPAKSAKQRPAIDRQIEAMLQQRSVGRQELLRLGQGTATIAGGNFRGILVDKLRQTGARSSQKTEEYFGTARHVLARNEGHYLATFESKTEVTNYLQSANEKRTKKHPDQAAKLWSPSPEVQQEVTDRLVLGKHDGTDLFGGKEKYKQSTLNDIARAMTLNSTYAAKDTERFVNKVRSIIPAAVAPKKTANA